MGILYNIVTIQNFANDARTEAALDAEGADDWSLVLANFKPNSQTGKPTSTLIFKKSLITSSSSSTSSSTSVSSSSNSDAPFMGTGWPYLPDEIEVTIGSRWVGNIFFSEDDVIRLKRVGPCSFNDICYTEDGTQTPNRTTNRLKIRISQTYMYWTPARVINTIYDTWTTSAGYAAHNLTTYDFKAWWDTSPSLTAYFKPSYFDVTTTSGFAPAMQYQGEIFKTFTFIDN